MRSFDRRAPRSPVGTDVTTLSLAEVLRALGLDHTASLLDVASQKAIARNEPPTSLLDHLMREQLRFTLEERARASLKRAAIFPPAGMKTYDFTHPKTIDRELIATAARGAVLGGRAPAKERRIEADLASVFGIDLDLGLPISSTISSPPRPETPSTSASPRGPRQNCS